MKYSKKIVPALLLIAFILFFTSAFSQEGSLDNSLQPGISEVRVFPVNAVQSFAITRFNVKQLLGDLQNRLDAGAKDVRFLIDNNGRRDTIKILDANAGPGDNIVTYPIARLMDLLQNYRKDNAKNLWIRFYVATFTQADVERYVQNNSTTPFTDDDKAQLLKKKTIVIKVPATVLPNVQMPTAAGSDGSYYVDYGKICPPPVNCG